MFTFCNFVYLYYCYCVSIPKSNKAIDRRYLTSPAVYIQSHPPSRPIIDSSDACNQAYICPYLGQSPAQFCLNSIYVLNLSPVNTKLTSLSDVYASNYSCLCAKVTVTVVTIATATCVLVILPINRQISPFLFYFSMQVISKYTVFQKRKTPNSWP